MIRFIVERLRVMDRKEIFSTSSVQSDEGYAGFIHRLMGFPGHVGWIASIDDEPVALVGIQVMWDGVASVAMFATDRFNEIGLPMTRFIKRNLIPNFVKLAGIHRAQCFSMNGHTVAHEWLEVLGAHREGVAEGYGKNGEDFTLFSWRFQ